MLFAKPPRGDGLGGGGMECGQFGTIDAARSGRKEIAVQLIENKERSGKKEVELNGEILNKLLQF